ncbi:MAG: S9 family peptidase [Bacteroidetes bacterium]|nr:MAG: S9 family peptidase [Bacteroidota bacterium]
MQKIRPLLLLWGLMQAQLPPLLDRELFFGDPEIASLQLSPNGRWLSFLKPYNGTLNVWLQPLQEGQLGEAFPITASSKQPITQYFWSQDGEYLLYVQDRDGDENYHLYRIRISQAAPGQIPPATDLTPREGIRVVSYAFPKFKPGVAYIGLNDRDPTLHDLYELNLATGELKRLYQNTEGILGWGIDEEGRIRFAAKTGPEGETILLQVQRKGQGFTFKKVYETAWDESASIAHLPRKGKEIYLITNKGVDKTRLVAFDPASGQEREIHRDPENRVDLGAAVFDDRTDKLRLVSYTDDKKRRYFFDPKLERWFRHWEERLPGGEVGLSSLTDDERYAIVAYTSDREPAQYFLWDAQKEALREIGRSHPTLPAEHLAERRPIQLRVRDGASIPAYLTLPKGVTPKNLPAVLLVHGGPWYRDYWGYDPFAQFLANRGYAVLQVNFRGSTGYGKAFLNAGNRQWGTGTMQHDLTDAVQQLVQEGTFDPRRIAIMGGSYGGYATLAGVTFTPELYACGVSIVGPSSILTLIRSVPPYWKPLIKIFYNRVGNPDDPADQERLKAQSPLYHVDRIRVPLLIVQGANDPRVKKQESDQIVAALHAKGYPVRYLLAPDEGHGFQKYENRMAMIVAIEQFLGERLGGRVQAEVPEKIARRLQELTVDPATVKPPTPESAAVPTATLRLPLQKPYRSRWLYQVSIRGKQFTAKGTEEWTLLPQGGWQFVESIESSDLPALRTADTTVLNAQGQMERYHRLQQGAEITLQRKDNKVEGSLRAMGQNLPIEAALEGTPLYPISGALRYYLASLPLQVGYSAKIPLLSLQQQKFTEARITVEGEEKILVAGQEKLCWRVGIQAEGVQQTIWIEQSTGLPWRNQTVVSGASFLGDRIE